MKLKLSKNAKLTLFTASVCVLLTTFVLADALLIPKTYAVVESISDTSPSASSAVISDYAYKDENITISISTINDEDVIYHVVDVLLSDVQYLKAAFAKDIYGKNVVEPTSKIAENNHAILAFSGDFYGVRDDGWSFAMAFCIGTFLAKPRITEHCLLMIRVIFFLRPKALWMGNHW
jgi:hypothetical protein